MSYDKVIKYLEYLENGEKIRSVGFVKIEAADQFCNVQIHITGLHPTESCIREVRFLGDLTEDRTPVEGIFGSISLQGGKGSLIKKKIPAEELCQGIGYDKLMAIRINLGKTREIICRWREGGGLEQQPEKREQTEPVQPENVSIYDRFQPQLQPEPESSSNPLHLQTQVESEPSPGLLHMQEQVQPQEQTKSQQIKDEEEKFSVPGMPTAPIIPPSLQENKWRQLSNIYPHISPFHDERDYLSIGPEDFVILPKKYYSLITNSFLLHGYYNYGHLILIRMRKRGDEVFYLGVPGNFYEKERQVAIMFGFESFECKKEPAEEGTYGYYMIRVEL